MTLELRRVIARDHPALAGHFPGHPIVPGVVILDEVVRAAGSRGDRTRLAGIESVKFVAPVAPGEAFSIRLEEARDDRVDFTCERDGEVLVSGRLVMEPDPA